MRRETERIHVVVRDLLDLPGIVLQGELPADGMAHGFDNNSDALDISHVNLAKYLEAADRALDMAIRLARKAGRVYAIGVYAEPCQVPMGLAWIKSVTLGSGQANVIAHVDRVLGMLAAGTLDPSPLVSAHMPLADAGVQSNLTVMYYPSGHMIYLDGDSRTAMKSDLAAFYHRTTAGHGTLARIRGILIAIALVVAVLALGFGIVYGIGSAAGGISVQLAIFYGFLLVLIVLGVAIFLGRRRQKRAQAQRADQIASRSR